MNKTAALSYSVSSGMEEQGSYKVIAHAVAYNGYLQETEHLHYGIESIGWKALSLFWESLNIDNWDAQLCWPDFESTSSPCSQY